MRVALAVVVALLLTACNSITPQKVDTTINESVPVVCAGVDLAWAGFEAYKAHNKVDANHVVKANAAYFTAKDICAAPPTSGSEALQAVLKAYMDFNTALAAAKKPQ